MKPIFKSSFRILQTMLWCCILQINAQTPGCTDELASNFNPNASLNDGSCTYPSASINPVTDWLLPQALNETSGLVLWNNQLWTHNDDTDINLYEIDLSNVDNYTTQTLTTTVNTDWEEISQDENYLYVGDFGNNANGNRTDLKILRVAKTSILQNNPVIDSIAFSYELQNDFTPTGSNNTNFDCEAFIVGENQIFLFTKEWITSQTSLYSLPKTPGTYEASYLATYDVNGLITGATYLEEERVVVLSGYSYLLQPFFFLLYDFQNDDFFVGNKRKISIDLPLHQVEAVATEDGLNYFISNERFNQSGILTEAKIHQLDLAPFLENYLNTLSVENSIHRRNQQVSLYPNPTSDVLHFDWNGLDLTNAHLVIYNQMGQRLNEYRLTSNPFFIDVSRLSMGMYYYRIVENGKTNTALRGKFLVR